MIVIQLFKDKNNAWGREAEKTFCVIISEF